MRKRREAKEAAESAARKAKEEADARAAEARKKAKESRLSLDKRLSRAAPAKDADTGAGVQLPARWGGAGPAAADDDDTDDDDKGGQMKVAKGGQDAPAAAAAAPPAATPPGPVSESVATPPLVVSGGGGGGAIVAREEEERLYPGKYADGELIGEVKIDLSPMRFAIGGREASFESALPFRQGKVHFTVAWIYDAVEVGCTRVHVHANVHALLPCSPLF